MHVKLSMEIETSNVEALKKLKHHIEYLLDLDNWPEIENVYNVEVVQVED